MKSEQFIKLLKLFQKHNLSIDFNQITLLCSVREANMESLLLKYEYCDDANQRYFMEILCKEDFITYYGYEEILNIISTLEPKDLTNLKYMLNKEDVVAMPRLMDFIRIYYKLSTKPCIAYSNQGVMEIINIIPEVEFESDAELLKQILLEKFDYEYNHYVTDLDVFFFEDYDGVLEDKIIKYYRFKNKSKKENPDKLIRKLTKESYIPQDKNKIISFRKED